MEANFDQDFKIIFPLTTPALVCQTDIKGVSLWWGIFLMEEAVHMWGREYMRNLCTSAQVF